MGKDARQQGSSGVGPGAMSTSRVPVARDRSPERLRSSNSTPLHSVYAVEEGKIYLSSLDPLGLRRRSGFPVVISRWPRSYRPTSRITHHHDHHSPPPLDLSPLSTGLFRCLRPNPEDPPNYTDSTLPTLPALPTLPTLLAYTLLAHARDGGRMAVADVDPGPHVKGDQRL
jgi:hypothetical protein